MFLWMIIKLQMLADAATLRLCSIILKLLQMLTVPKATVSDAAAASDAAFGADVGLLQKA